MQKIGPHPPLRQRALQHKESKDARVARVTGLEPATSGVTGRRSNQLSYTRNWRERRCNGRARRRQPGSRGVVGGDGFEPPTLSV